MLWFVVTCKGAGGLVKGQGGISADDVESVRVFVVAIAVRGGGIESASGIDDGSDVVGVAVVAVGGGIGVKDAGVAAGDGNVVKIAVASFRGVDKGGRTAASL